MLLDKVYIINLEHRTDRKQQIISELTRVGITNYEFFKAIKPTIETVNKWNSRFLNPIPQWFQNTGGDDTKYRIGSLGCMLSHIEILKECIKKDYTNVLILEDDCEFLIPEGISFENILTLLKPQIDHLQFGILYLAGNHNGSNLTKISDNIFKVNGSLTTGSYIINKSVMKYIVDNIQGFEREVDIYYGNIIQPMFPCYCIMPHLTKQATGYSDIVQREVNYKL